MRWSRLNAAMRNGIAVKVRKGKAGTSFRASVMTVDARGLDLESALDALEKELERVQLWKPEQNL